MLDEQTISVPLAQGADTKTDELQLPPGKLAALSNAVFQNPKKLRKRPGTKTLGNRRVDLPGFAGFAGTTIPAGQALASLRDELLLGDGTHLHSYMPGADRWAPRGPYRNVGVAVSSVLRNQGPQGNPDGVYHAASGLSCFIFEEPFSGQGSRYVVLDAASGAEVLSGVVSISGTTSQPKVVAFDRWFLLTWVQGTTLYCTPIDTTAPVLAASVGAPIVLTSILAASGNYDVAVLGSRFYYAFATSTPEVALSYLPASLAGGAGATYTGTASGCVAILPGATSLALAWSDGSTVKYRVVDTNLTTLLTTTTVDASHGATRITAAYFSGSATWQLLYEVAGPRVLTANVSASAAGAAAEYMRGVSLASKAWLHADGIGPAVQCVLLAYDSPLQASYFLVADTYPYGANPVAKVLYGLGGGARSRASLAEVSATASGVYQIAVLAKRLAWTTGDSVVGARTYSQAAVSAVSFDFTVRGASPVEAEDAVLLAGGFLTEYDGAAPVELGFHLFPEGVTAPSPGGSNVYQYVACYEWWDNQGRLHRSAPSPAVTSAQTNPIGLGNTVTVTIPTLRIVNQVRRFSGSIVALAVYRTAANGTIFYRVPAYGAEAFNSTAVDSVTYVDNVQDVSLVGQPQLYTTGGVLENIAPGPVSQALLFRGRVFAIDAEDPLSLWRSHEMVAGQPVEFSDFTKVKLDARGGPCTALAQLDEKLIAFKAGCIFVLAGQGPDRTGANDDMGSGMLLPADVGCVNPRSICQSGSGIGFQSAKGYYMLDRSLNVQYIGAEAEAWNTSPIVDAFVDPQKNRARLTLETGREIVFDDLVNQWGTFDLAESPGTIADVTLWRGVKVSLSTTGVARMETPGLFLDGATGLGLSLKTGWLSFAGLQGYQRVRRLQILGEYLSAHSLRVDIAYDYDPTIVQTVTFTGGSPEQWVVKLARQKCQAIQIAITEIAGGGEGLSLSALAFEVGLARKLYKQPASRVKG